MVDTGHRGFTYLEASRRLNSKMAKWKCMIFDESLPVNHQFGTFILHLSLTAHPPAPAPALPAKSPTRHPLPRCPQARAHTKSRRPQHHTSTEGRGALILGTTISGI